MGIKVNILYDRLLDLWNGSSSNDSKKSNVRSRVRVNESMTNIVHNPSQADYLDAGSSSIFPPAPVVQSKPNSSYDHMMRGAPQQQVAPGPAPANSMLGGGFGLF